MARYLILRLEAPIAAFGDIMVDAIGPVSDLPSAAMLTGLLANALGLRREQKAAHQHLQDRLVHAARRDRVAGRFTEFQTAKLQKDDKSWTTRGVPEGRAGGDDTYDSPHIRYRAHDADLSVVVALTLEPADMAPTLDDLAAALVEPWRPLFIGRKPCLPSRPVYEGFVEAPSLLEAIRAPALAPTRRGTGAAPILTELPASQPPPPGFRRIHRCDRRDWLAGVHTGDTIRLQSLIPRDMFGPREASP